MIIEAETIYIGADDVEYPAIAEYDTVEKTITRYDYKDQHGVWVNTEERDWSDQDIQLTFYKECK